MEQVKGVSNVIRLPRLGKVRLGIKVKNAQGVEYPKATEWFVCPPEVQAIYGEKPTELRVAFPVEDERVFARQSYSYYSRTRGLICRGDGRTAMRLLDTATGALPIETSKKVEMRPWPCNPKPQEGEVVELCHEYEGKGYKAPQCKLLMQLQVLLPDVPGLGVWQIDTGSFYGVVGLNSCLAMLRGFTGGRVSMIPVRLLLEPQEVQVDGKKKTIRTLRFIVPLSLADLQKALALPALAALLPDPEAPERELEPEPEGEPEPGAAVVVEAQVKAAPASEAKVKAVTPLMPSEPPPGEEWPGFEEEHVPPASKVPEVGLRKVLRDTMEKRWPGKPETHTVFLESVCGKGIKTVEQVPEALLVEVIQKATPKERPQAKKEA